jgi:hypothetical protein
MLDESAFSLEDRALFERAIASPSFPLWARHRFHTLSRADLAGETLTVAEWGTLDTLRNLGELLQIAILYHWRAMLAERARVIDQNTPTEKVCCRYPYPPGWRHDPPK